LALLGITCIAVVSIPVLQTECQLLTRLNIDCDFAAGLNQFPVITQHLSDEDPSDCANAVRGSMVGFRVLHPDRVSELPPIQPHQNSITIWLRLLDNITELTAVQVADLFYHVHSDPIQEDRFEFNEPLLEMIFKAFIDVNAFIDNRFDRFRKWFLNPNSHSLLTDQVWKLLVTHKQCYFNNVLKLLDPYHSPGDWQAGYCFFTGLSTYFYEHAAEGINPAAIEVYIQKSQTSEWRRFLLPHRIEGIKLTHVDPRINRLDGCARLILKSVVFGTAPFLQNLLRWFEFFARFSFIEKLVELIWYLRARFSTTPAVLGAVLSCCSHFPGDRRILQQLPLAKEFASLTIPFQFKQSETAYSQISEIVTDFVAEYNAFIENLGSFGCTSITDVRPSELLPHMIVTLENIQSVIAEIAVSRFGMKFILEEAFLSAFRCPDIPLCRFVVSEVVGKDFFGFTKDEWQTAFASPPFLNRIDVREDGFRVSFLKLKRPKLTGSPSSTGEPDSRTLLVCLCWIYSLENGFSLDDFCDRSPGLMAFLDDRYPSQEIIFHSSNVELSGPLDRFLPPSIRKVLFRND
jgi:hypothetical protein